MNNPRHISELLPGVIEGICTRASEDFVEFSREPAAVMKVYNQVLVIELPFPPSVNHYWGTRVISKGKRGFIQRYIAEAGQKFKHAVEEHFLVENITQKFSGPLACTVDLFPPCNHRRDCDNYCKGLLDALGSVGLYDDDSQIIDLRIRMHAKRAPGSVRVTLESISAQHCAHNQMELVS